MARSILELSELPSAGAPVDQALSQHPQLAHILRDSFGMARLPNRAEIDLKSRSENGKTIGFTLSLVRDVAGEPTGAALFFKDLTHVEHKEEQERLKDRLAALGQMAANLAHEIRNPLAAIEVSCSLLKRRAPAADAGSRDLLDKIIAEVKRLNRTITSSLEFVRPVSLTAGARVDRGRARRCAHGRGRPARQARRPRRAPRVSRAFRLPHGSWPAPPGLRNLFLNAFEAMGESGTLAIEVDHGPAPAAPTTPYRPAGSQEPAESFDTLLRRARAGLRRRHRRGPSRQALLPFFTTKKQGSGVGLSMAKKIVDSHRGLIDVVSRVGEGTVFTVRLPVVTGAAETAT
jgi:hypothetical protein